MGKRVIKEPVIEDAEIDALKNTVTILTRAIASTVIAEIAEQMNGFREVVDSPARRSRLIDPEPQERPLLLNAADGARLLKVSRSNVYELMHSRQIPSIRLGKRILIPREALVRFIEQASGDRMSASSQP